MYEKIKEAVEYIKSRVKIEPQIGMILGSGLGYLSEELEDSEDIDYKYIPHFPQTTVQGHEGKLVFGKLKGKNVVMMKGRFHAYEGHDLKDIIFPVYVMKELGVEGLIITNAAGGVNRTYEPGYIVADTDFINLAFRNPLIGPNDEKLGPRFPQMVSPIDREWLKKVKEKIKEYNIEIHEGTYTWLIGSSYETPAEIRMIRRLGGDLVGMSTMPEVIAAVHCGIRVIAFSVVSNMAAGILPQPLTHEEVMETTERVKHKFAKVVKVAVQVF